MSKSHNREYTDTAADISDGFHTYGLLWTPSLVEWFFDGKSVRRVTDVTIIPKVGMQLRLHTRSGYCDKMDVAATFSATFRSFSFSPTEGVGLESSGAETVHAHARPDSQPDGVGGADGGGADGGGADGGGADGGGADGGGAHARPARPPSNGSLRAQARDSSEHSVLHVISDDLRPDLGAYGAVGAHTPNIDALASTGLTFDRAYAQQAVCGPSRNSFMSGRRPDRSRSWNFINHFREDHPEWTSLPGVFRKAGALALGAGKTYHPKLPPAYDSDASWSPAALPYRNPCWNTADNTNISFQDGGLPCIPCAIGEPY